MCEGDNHGIMLKCMYVSMIVCMYVCSRSLYGDGGCLGGSGHGRSDYSIWASLGHVDSSRSYLDRSHSQVTLSSIGTITMLRGSYALHCSLKCM